MKAIVSSISVSRPTFPLRSLRVSISSKLLTSSVTSEL